MSDLPSRLDGESSVLVLASSMEAAADEACLDFLSLEPPESENVLWVTFTRSPDGCIQD